MNSRDIRHIISTHGRDMAFIFGNGVNRYPDNPSSLSWEGLMMKLWDMASFQTLSRRPEGISLTEFYDIVSGENRTGVDLPGCICELMKQWRPGEHHSLITDRIRQLEAPLLTTNFDETFALSAGCRLHKTGTGGRFTDYYPWNVYHAPSPVEAHCDGFGIWYINGMLRYRRSIRLGLSHYMGSVERARGLIYK